MNKEEIERQLKLSKRQNKYERYDYLCSEFNGINYCIKLEKYTNKLQQQNKKYKEVIDKIKDIFNNGNFEDGCDCLEIEELLDNLKEVK